MENKKDLKKEPVYKVTLSTGKVVILREMTIKRQEMATLAIAKRAGDSPLAAQALLQSELLKQLIVEIDGRRPSPVELENLDALFTYKEFLQLQKVLLKITDIGEGSDFLDKFDLEVVTSGE